MSFSISPGVTVTEVDLTTVIPAVLTTDGGFCGSFRWGPANEVVLVSNENELVSLFGAPDSDNAIDFFTAANFLSYANALRLVRVVSDGSDNRLEASVAYKSASASKNGAVVTIAINAGGTSYQVGDVVSLANPATLHDAATVRVTAVDGITGAATTIVLVSGGSRYITGTAVATSGGHGTGLTIDITKVTVDIFFQNDTDFLSYTVDPSITDKFCARWLGALGNDIKISVCFDARSFNTWGVPVGSPVGTPSPYAGLFQGAPGTSDFALTKGAQTTTQQDECHVVVIDVKGKFTGLKNQVLEKYAFVSKLAGAKTEDGSSNYWVDVINAKSNYVRVLKTNLVDGVEKSADLNHLFNTGAAVANVEEIFANGKNGDAPSVVPGGEVMQGYDLFKNAEVVNVSLMLLGGHPAQVAQYVTQNICEVRKDCISFISPAMDSVVNYNKATVVEDIKADRDLVNISSSYAVMDDNWKLMYDKYNDTERWIPCNSDVAGCCARTDADRDPWWSPAGLNRGQIKNVIKLAYNADKTDRDDLYLYGINPIVSFPGQGTVLFGDKTMLAKPSAFDRINVRRLFIVLEKAIAIAARYFLFEFNDAFTRLQFKHAVEPYLERVKAARGVYDFKVVCDETNNTGEVIDHNQFVGDIYIKPARSINYINLNFIAVRTDVAFEEIVGKF